MAKWERFRQCPGCGYNFATGEGEQSCNYYDCPYVPQELNVSCDVCRFDFFTLEGNPSCEDPAMCPHAEEARSHVENMRKWRELVGLK